MQGISFNSLKSADDDVDKLEGNKYDFEDNVQMLNNETRGYRERVNLENGIWTEINWKE